ncbi:BatA domain-containing protein [Marilutibacter chinensis]|uniref:BatA domain-containing protein n=1 Tax=Marilutibacter chinensis TaxID=2912247 RepID=A0ABS9HWX1_9GAMM|nr:BatA domain-containing protein [Lysobacter chinensis]MCF7221198.1 BatA domain-containing protein [Lysobacter chinensis]MCF7223061.1 BatA domain-containing protein [Lysobacter chinensis]
MPFGLLLPAALAALAALLMPLLIHLARRNEQRPVEFAALRWLRRRPRPRQRIRFEEWPLLLVRLLLLTLIALWLARPVLHGEQARTPWTVVIPGVDPARLPATGDERERIRWLAPGFPGIGQPAPERSPAFASLLRQLDAELPADAALTVLVPQRLEHADAQLPVLSREVEWQVVPGAMPAPPAVAVAPPALHMVAADPGMPALRYLRAAAHAWRSGSTDASVAMDVVAPAQLRLPEEGVLVWLVPGELPAPVRDWVVDGGTALLDVQTLAGDAPAPVRAATIVWHDGQGAPLLESAALGRGRLLRLTRTMSPAAMPQLLDPGFPARLRESLWPPAPPARVEARAYAPLTGATAYPQPPRELRPWWAVLIALVLLVERWLATSRRREARQ